MSGIRDLLGLIASRRAQPHAPLFYWEHPVSGDAVLGVGVAHAVRTSGPERIAQAGRAVLDVLARTAPQESSSHLGAPRPRFVGGFAFDSTDAPTPLWREFPTCWFFLPEQLWVVNDGRCWAIRVSPCAQASTDRQPASSLPDGAARRWPGAPSLTAADERHHWLSRVERALSMVEAGAITKVVLARHRTWTAAREIPVLSIARQLRDARPGCFTFCVSPGSSQFFGSTPELLVRLQNGRFEAQALAGTAARGGDARQDRDNACRLLHSPKNQREHTAVIAGIEQALAPVADALQVAAQPGLMALPEAYHLHTPITGHLRASLSCLDLAQLLHPTPAVCGTPRQRAGALIETQEPQRGWYTDAVGWMDSRGDGVFAVALRAALATGRECTVWAGAGIVAGSDPVAEFDETEIKMRAMVDAVTGQAGAPVGAPLAPLLRPVELGG